MVNTLDTFKEFIVSDAWNMYVTGAAGTGKTTDLKHSVQYCIDNEIEYVVCAFTHKACGILRSKLPPNAIVVTLHSFLKKCPSINQDATNVNHVNTTIKVGDQTIKPKVVFIDEYSMVGEKDWLDLGEMQDPDYDGVCNMKICWLGDPHQLPPVGDVACVQPNGSYQVKLTKIYRNDNPLQIPLNKLISYMSGTRPEPLGEVPQYFERGLNIVEEYCSKPDADQVILAFTNQQVEKLNYRIHERFTGRDEVQESDTVFSPSTQGTYKFIRWLPKEEVTYIDLNWSDPLHLGSKYRTLENLIKSDLCEFCELEDEDGDILIHAVVFGHYQFKKRRDFLTQEAVESNQDIENKHKGFKAAGWARANHEHPLARKRAKAWRDCLSFKDCVICIDFNHAMTVHKSQGSTYNRVFLDMDDIAQVAQRDLQMYFRLTYVGISRAEKYVGTN
jgi:hypothetical protein